MKITAKLAAACAVGVVAVALTAVPRAASAVDDCLTEPNGPSAQGKHWHYHIERGTGRHCWYQRGQDDTTASSAAQDQSTAANDDASPATDQALSPRDQAPPAKPPAKPVAKKIESPSTRAIADARAELPTRPRAQDDNNAAPVAPPAPPSAMNASVWPDPQAAIGAKPAAVDPSSAAASDNTDTQADTTASITPAPSPAPVTQAGPLGDRHLGSLPMLLLVAFGALGLAGLTGNTVYRLAGLRRRVRPEDRWSRNVNLQPAPPTQRPRPIPVRRPEPIQETFEHQDTLEGHDAFENDLEPEQIARAPVEREPLEQERFEPPKRERFEMRVEIPRTEKGSADGNRKREQIEAYLAQLTRQLQADLEMAARVD